MTLFGSMGTKSKVMDVFCTLQKVSPIIASHMIQYTSGERHSLREEGAKDTSGGEVEMLKIHNGNTTNKT